MYAEVKCNSHGTNPTISLAHMKHSGMPSSILRATLMKKTIDPSLVTNTRESKGLACLDKKTKADLLPMQWG